MLLRKERINYIKHTLDRQKERKNRQAQGNGHSHSQRRTMASKKGGDINEMFYDGCEELGGITAALGEDWLKQCTCALS